MQIFSSKYTGFAFQNKKFNLRKFGDYRSRLMDILPETFVSVRNILKKKSFNKQI